MSRRMGWVEAEAKLRAGQRVRHPGMGPGWSVFWSPAARGLFWLNPHTGTDYEFAPANADLGRSDWEVVKPA